MALNNPLIDDYSLKGARGLLINITGGEDLTLFEVDEIVNKIRSEVDHAAEIIIGSITDPALSGKVRVSIVATALDGQQPESKSVINMVHRIQNRNPGYSDFSSIGGANSFNFTQAGITTSGANALKVENDLSNDNEIDTKQEMEVNQNLNNNISTSEKLTDDKEESLILTEEIKTEDVETNGLENFGLADQEPNLFDQNENVDSLVDEKDHDKLDDEDFEIPAFLRRQKN